MPRGAGHPSLFETAICGCGTAGLAAALLLARDGHRVTLFERFETPRPIGSGLMLQPTGLAVLAELGLEGAVRAVGAPIKRLEGKAGNRVVLDVSYSALSDATLHAVGIHRSSLFDILHQAVVQAAVPIYTGREVASVTDRHLILSNGERHGPFDIIVDATGTRTTLAEPSGRQLNFGALWANVATIDAFPADALVQRYRNADVMAGVMPSGRATGSARDQSAFFWSLRVTDYDQWLNRGLDAWKSDVVALWPETAALLQEFTDQEQLTLARYAHRSARKPINGHLIHIGDAWHSASPQLGQGANMALLDAYALAAGLRQATDPLEGLHRAVSLRSGHVRLYQWLTAILTPVYQSDGRAIPWVRDRIMAPVSRMWPFPRLQAALVAGLVGRPLQRLGIHLAAPETGR